MSRPLIKVLKDDLSFIMSLRTYKSFYFAQNFNTSKEFQLMLDIKFAPLFKKDYFIYLSRKKVFVIENIKENEKTKLVTIRGRDVKSILDRRITIPPLGFAYDSLTGNGETIIKHLINVNAVNTVDSTRIIPGFEIAPNQNRGSLIKWDSRYKNLIIEAENITAITGLGWSIEVDQTNKKFIFDVIKGVDRSYGQNVNPIVIFSRKHKNMRNVIHSMDASDHKNIAYLAGQGAGADRQIIKVSGDGGPTGLNRRETLVDARDLDTIEALTSRGSSKLEELKIVENTEMEVTNNNFTYGDDWNLGDLVSVQNTQGYETQQITEVYEAIEAIESIEITTGNPSKTLASKIKKITDEQKSII